MSYKRLTKYNEYSRNAEVYAYTVGNEDVYFDGIDIVGNENSSLAQEIIDKLALLEDKIENETLIEISCKVGDIVYQFDNGGEIYESKIRSIYYVENTLFYDCGFFAFDNTAIGESIFLTKAKAEKKLEELKEN